MPTIWQILTGTAEKKEVLEFKVYNPLKLRLGTCLKIDTVDLSDHRFVVTGLREVTRTINGEKFQFIDYDIVSRPLEGDEIQYRLRLTPAENNLFVVTLLSKVSECGYDKSFHEGLSNEEFVEGDAKYWRVNDVKEFWVGATKFVLADGLKNGGYVQYWDFWRETTDADGNAATEFYIVEMDEVSGYFTFWSGPVIDSKRVDIF